MPKVKKLDEKKENKRTPKVLEARPKLGDLVFSFNGEEPVSIGAIYEGNQAKIVIDEDGYVFKAKDGKNEMLLQVVLEK